MAFIAFVSLEAIKLIREGWLMRRGIVMVALVIASATTYAGDNKKPFKGFLNDLSKAVSEAGSSAPTAPSTPTGNASSAAQQELVKDAPAPVSEWDCRSHQKPEGAFDVMGNYVGGYCDISEQTMNQKWWTTIYKERPMQDTQSPDKTLIGVIQESYLEISQTDVLPKGADYFTRTYKHGSASAYSEGLVVVRALFNKFAGSPKDAISVVGYYREFCASDSTNSISEPSNFRSQLISKYGQPKTEKTAASMAAQTQKERDAYIADAKKNRSFENPVSAASTNNVINDYNSKIRDLNSQGGRTFSLSWESQSGDTIEIAEKAGACSGKSLFEMSLYNNGLIKKVAVDSKSAREQFEASRAKTANTPSF